MARMHSFDRPRLMPALALLLLFALSPVRTDAAEVAKAEYLGWSSLALKNGLIEAHVVPEIGGRVIQIKLGDFEYLWVNPQLAGKLPPPSGLGPNGTWLNYGGDKLWPAPQGWGSDEAWPGPPDAVLDGSPHASAILTERGQEAAIQLTSRPDPRSGIQFSRTIKIYDNAARVSFDSTMKNVDNRLRRWSIWQVTQLNAANRYGPGYNPEIRCYSPLNPASLFPRGYLEMFGLVNNPSFKANTVRKLVSAHYCRVVGKIGMDNAAGWVATVDGTDGYAFVQRFTHFPGRKYPDDTSAQFWMNGAGQIVTGETIVDCKDDPIETPHLVESEILSPLVELQPGQSYSFRLDWFVARIGGKFPVLDCTPVGLTCQPFVAHKSNGQVHLTGRFGVFYPAQPELIFLDAAGAPCGRMALKDPVSPNAPLVLDTTQPLPAQAATASLLLNDPAGKPLGELAHTPIHAP